MVHRARLCEQNLVGAIKRAAGVAPGPRRVEQIGDLSRGLVIGDALRSYIQTQFRSASVTPRWGTQVM